MGAVGNCIKGGGYFTSEKTTEGDAFRLFIKNLRKNIKAEFKDQLIHVILDNHPCHKARASLQVFIEEKFIMTRIPAYSSQFNCIERVWAWVKARVLKQWTAIQMQRTEMTRVQLLICLVMMALRKGIKENNYNNVLRMNDAYIEEQINLP